MVQQNSRFAFLDEGEALRRLGLDRDALLALVRDKRIRAYPGVGKGNFYRLKDIEALYAELHDDAGQDTVAAAGEGFEPAAPGRKLFDPAYKVHVRLQADLKWYDLEEQDLEAWVRELHADGYVRQRANITRVIDTLTRLVTLMDQAAASWQVLEAKTKPSPGVAGNKATSSRGKPLPMAGDRSSTLK
jgi:hypothetical protein